MKHKIIKAGRHSLAVIVPAKFVHALGIGKGDEVEVSTDTQKGKMIVNFSGTLQLKLPSSKD